MRSLIRFRNVAKCYGVTQILDAVNLDVPRGEVVSIQGPSGAGKSTLMQLVAGLDDPTGGEIVNRALRIGYAFQEPRLLPWRTVRDNLRLPLVAQGRRRREAVARVVDCLERVELEGYENYYPHQLSGGMAQRVALARALAVEPDLLMLDEAFSSLDVPLRRRMEALVTHEVVRNSITVLMVSHTPADCTVPVHRRWQVENRTVREIL